VEEGQTLPELHVRIPRPVRYRVKSSETPPGQ
jgi:hypothetical protein